MTDITRVYRDILQMVNTESMSQAELIGLGAFIFGVTGEIAITEKQNPTMVKSLMTHVMQRDLRFTPGQSSELFIEYVRSSKSSYNETLCGIIEDGQKAFGQYQANDLDGLQANLLSKIIFAKMHAESIPVPGVAASNESSFDRILREFPIEGDSISHFHKLFEIIAGDMRKMAAKGGEQLPDAAVSDLCQLLYYKTLGIENSISKRGSFEVSASFLDKYFTSQMEALKHHVEVFAKYTIQRGVPKHEIVFYLIHLYFESVHKQLFPNLPFDLYED